MAKRLNPQRRREMRAKAILLEGRKARNPVLTDADVSIKTMGQPRALWGSSLKLDKGYVHSECGFITYAQHKRRSPTREAVKCDLDTVAPYSVLDKLSDIAKPSPVDTKRVNRPNRVVPKSKRLWSSL